MIKKLLGLLLLTFLLSGCTTQYELEIHENLNITETMTELMNKDEYKYDSEEDAIYGVNNLITSYDPNRLYNTDFISKEDTYGFKTTREYNSLVDYYNGTLLVKQLYDSVGVTNDNGIVSIKSIGDLKLNNILYIGEPDEDGEYPADTIIPTDTYFKVKLPFKVIRNNADRVDKQNNIYYWDITTDTTKDKTVEIEFDTNKKFVSLTTIISKLDYTFVLIIVIILIGLFIYSNVKKKNKRNNEI